MYKKLIPLFAAVGLLLWAGCSDVPTPLNRNETGLRITISDGTAGSRTLYPNAVFSKYILHFEGPGTHADITLTAGQNSTTVSGLVAGTWTVTATGYVMINGIEHAAAEGSHQVNVTTGSFQGIGITIKASQNGANGFFSYSVSFPHARVNDAELRIYPFGDNEWDWDTQAFDLRQTSSGSLSLASGYYVMYIRLSTDYQMAARREIVHIYSNMETSAEYIFTDEDFTDAVTLSGTANVTIDGQVPPYFVWITAFNGNLPMDTYFGFVDTRNDQQWSMQIPAFDTDTPVYFAVETGALIDGRWDLIQKKTSTYVMVKDEDISGIEIICNIGYITLSGTVDVSMYGQTPDGVYVLYMHPDLIQVLYASANREDNVWSWSMRIPSFDEDTPMDFAVEAYLSGCWERKWIDQSVTVNDQNANNINLGRVDLIVDIDIANAIPLTADVWKNGNITTSNLEDWYSISVTAGTTYYFWFNHSYVGDGTKTLDGIFNAYYSNESTIFSHDRAWFNPVAFTANSNDTVYIKVYGLGYTTGTYAIGYSTDSHWHYHYSTPTRPDWLEPGAKLVYSNGVLFGAGDYEIIGSYPFVEVWNDYTGQGVDLSAVDGTRIVMYMDPRNETGNWVCAVFFLEDEGSTNNNINANAYNLVFDHKGSEVGVALNSSLLYDYMTPTAPDIWTTQTVNLNAASGVVRQIIFSAIGENTQVWIDNIRLVPKN